MLKSQKQKNDDETHLEPSDSLSVALTEARGNESGQIKKWTQKTQFSPFWWLVYMNVFTKNRNKYLAELPKKHREPCVQQFGVILASTSFVTDLPPVSKVSYLVVHFQRMLSDSYPLALYSALTAQERQQSIVTWIYPCRRDNKGRSTQETNWHSSRIEQTNSSVPDSSTQFETN